MKAYFLLLLKNFQKLTITVSFQKHKRIMMSKLALLLLICLGSTLACKKKCRRFGGGSVRPGPNCPKLPEGLAWVNDANGHVPEGAVGVNGIYVGRTGYDGEFAAGKVRKY